MNVSCPALTGVLLHDPTRSSLGMQRRCPRWIVCRLVAGLALAALSLPAADSTATATAATTAPPAIAPAFSGALANGVRFTIQPHGSGLGRISVRLIVHAGSLDERDDELGYAHFVEHMAFNGTRHYPPGKLVAFFQRLGLNFGPDLCAVTNFDHTTYRLDLPAGRTAELAEALEVLRDFADGIEFPAAELQREKGVVLSELAVRDNSDQQIEVQRLGAVYGGTLLPQRLPIGTRASIEGATPEALRTYYQRCYRPERMSIVIAGDVTIEAARTLVNRSFGSLSAVGARVPPVGLSAPAGGLRAHLVTTNPMSAGTVNIVALARRDATTTTARHEALGRRVVMDLLNQRLAERRTREPNRFGDADARVLDGATRHFRQYVVSASASAHDWPAALALVETELRRAREQGFTDDEIHEQVAAQLARRRADRDAIAGQTPDLVADRISHALTAGESWRSPALAVAEAERYLASFTPAMAQSTLRDLFSEDRLQLLLFAPRPPENGRNAVVAAYRESASRPLETSTAATAGDLQFHYTDFGPAGKIADRRTEEDLGISLVRLANDVRLNVRSSATEPGRFRLAARFGRGVPDVPRDKPGLAHLATHLIAECDLGRHTREEVKRLFALRAVSFHAGYGSQVLVTMEGPVAQLSFALQMLTAHVSDLRLDEARLKTALSDYAVCRASKLDDSAAHAGYEAALLMASGDPRLRDPPAHALQGYAFADVAAWAKTHCLEDRLELGLIGDFDSAVAIDAAAASIGTLTPRRGPPAKPAPGVTLRTKPAHEVFREPLADKVAAVLIAWPASGAAEARTWWALSFAISVLEDRLQKVLRQELGATYSPQGGLMQNDLQPGMACAMVALTFEPDSAAKFARRTIEIADELARRGVSEEEFPRLREPLIAKATEVMRSNAWWLESILSLAQSTPEVINEVRTIPSVVRSLTRSEVTRAARDHLRSSAASSVIVIPTAPAGETVAANSAAAHSASGERKFQANDLAGALADFTRAIEVDPRFAAAYVNRSVCRLQQGDVDGAVADCTKAIELDPKISLAYSNRGAARISKGDLAAALADFTEALRLDPASTQSYNNRGVVRLQQGDIDGAVADWTKAIELNPGNAKAFTNRGAAKLRRGQVDAAIADELMALQLDPSDPDTHFNLGSARHQKGQLDAALADYSQALELNPDTPNVNHQRGKLRHARGDLNGALADYTAAIRLNPRNIEALTNRGVIRHGKADYDGAIADFSAVIELQPDSAPSYTNRAGARQAKKDFAGALADCDKAIELDPKFAEGYNTRGFTKQNSGDLDGAIADYTKAIELSPEVPLHYNNRANAKKAKGDRFGAMDDFDRAIQLGAPHSTPGVNAPPLAPSPATRPPVATTRPPAPATTTKKSPPSDARALVRSGDTRRLRRDFPGAIADYSKAIAADPTLADAYHGRGMARALRNDPRGAIEDQTKAIELQPALASAYVERGNVRRMQRDFASAIADYDKAIELQPKVPAAHYHRGLAHQGKPDHATALIDFETALKLNPGYVPAYNGRGYSQYMLGRFQQAVATLTDAIERSPTYVPAYYNRGLARQARGELERALADFDKVIEVAPTYTGAHASRANVRHALGQFERALSDYEHAITTTRAATNYPRLYRAVLQRRLQQGDPAADLTQAMQTWSATWTKNIARFLNGALSEADFLAASREGAGGTPLSRTCEFHYFAGMMCLLANDLTGARAHFEKSVETRQARLASHLLARAELRRLPAAANP
jgi:zinc protease